MIKGGGEVQLVLNWMGEGIWRIGVEGEERITMGGKSRGEVRGENGQVTRMTTKASTRDSLRKWYEIFGGRGQQLEKKVLLVVSGADVD